MRSERAVKRTHVCCPRRVRLRRKHRMLKQHRQNDAKWEALGYFETKPVHNTLIQIRQIRKTVAYVESAPNEEAVARRQQQKLEKQKVQQLGEKKPSESKKQKEARVEKSTADLKTERAAKEQKAQQEQALKKKEKKEREERERLEKEQAKLERQQREEAERQQKAAEKKAKDEAERARKEQQKKLEEEKRLKREAEEKARQEAAEKQRKLEEEQRLKKEAEEKARLEQQQKLEQEQALKLKKEAEQKQKSEQKQSKKQKKVSESSDATPDNHQQGNSKSKKNKQQHQNGKEEVIVQKHVTKTESSAPKQPGPITEQLVVDVVPDENNGHYRMKSSVDSGVDISAESLRSSQKSSSNESISEETVQGSQTPRKSSETSKQIAAKQSEILQQITEFVTYAQQKLSTTQVVHSEAPRKVFTFQMPTPLPVKKAPVKRERAHRLLPEDIEYCTYMIEHYGDNYDAMAKDPKNRFLDDSRTLQRKIRIFKSSCHFDEYLQQKQAV